MRRETDAEICRTGNSLAQRSKAWGQRGLAASKANSQTSVFVKLMAPFQDALSVELRRLLGRIAEWTSKVAEIGQRE